MSQRQTTRQAWLARFVRVADYIAAHLDEPLDLQRLAEVACLSPWHFQRSWLAFTGETLAQMVTRLRLHRAAGELIEGDANVEAVGRRAGYGSTAAFTRSFARAYGRPPAAYRAEGRLNPPMMLSLPEEGNPRMYEVRVEHIAPVTLAAIDHRGNYMGIEQAFNRILGWAAGRGLLGPSVRLIGVFHDDPDQVPEAELRSEAGLAVPEGTAVEAPVKLVDLPGGRHAILRFKGPYAELKGAYRWFYGTWLPGSGHEPADAPCWEDYLTNPREVAPADNVTEIHLPLKD